MLPGPRLLLREHLAREHPTPDLLGFAGVERVAVPAAPLTRQVAEKLHAYTRVYEGSRGSTRTKDLVDLVLIAQLFALDAAALRGAIDAVFSSRATHGPSQMFPQPPAQWRVPYRRLAIAVGLDGDLDAGYAAATGLLGPILARTTKAGSWDPTSGEWQRD